MSKKDYQAIASAVHIARAQANTEFNAQGGARTLVERAEGIAALENVAARLAHVFAMGNSRFDRERFIQACETGTCKGMRKVAA